MQPYYEQDGITIFNADCREVLPTLAAGSVDLVLTDPPYGVGKAEWDCIAEFDWLYPASRAAALALAVMPGITNLMHLPHVIGEHTYRWTLSIQIINAIVRGAIGFGNWIPCVVYARDGVSIYSCNQDATQIAIRGKMPDHPSPKPYDAMKWLVARLPGESVLDPFMGSGTTLVAAKAMGRCAVGIEIEERYCELAAKRLQQSVLPLAAAR